ncbi:MAG: MATE family efflux transporter [Deltaproteobacteria bacterium]|nr:MATE family efflux transporter [Deltaproteobacteria bacterium]
MKGKNDLTKGKVSRNIISLTWPMIFGVMGIIIFNLVDTFYVSLLGTDELAAISFTFPVVLVINSIAIGMGKGTATLVSHAFGMNDYDKTRSIASNALLLSLLVVVIVAALGLLFLDPIFNLLNAPPKLHPLIKSYMLIWFPGIIFVVFPMVGNNIIRALGDSRTPSTVMIIAAITNSILDPLLIFGLGPFPAMGLKGAALATVLSRSITFSIALWILIKREKLISYKGLKFIKLIRSWMSILYVGIPNALAKMAQPLSAGLITAIMAQFGKEAVAGYGVAAKLEVFALILVKAIASIMIPFTGQNLGGNRLDRIKQAIRFVEIISLLSGLLIFLLLFILRFPLASLFSSNQTVVKTITTYICLVPPGYLFYGITLNLTAILNGLKKPLHASLLHLLQVFAVMLPLAFLGARYLSFKGVFLAITVAYITGGIASHFLTNHVLAKIKEASQNS